MSKIPPTSVVHTRSELVAAIQAAVHDDVPLFVIEWHRPTGVTTIRLRPARYARMPLTRQARARAYAVIIKRLRALSVRTIQ